MSYYTEIDKEKYPKLAALTVRVDAEELEARRVWALIRKHISAQEIRDWLDSYDRT